MKIHEVNQYVGNQKANFHICKNSHWFTMILQVDTKEIEIIDTMIDGTESKS
jgi:hypothetical protein